ncbi:acetylserotonin O-methyltransferase [Bradyrhizobium sp. CB1015]|uniref:acetylserotonin O-methyltransferase n=1 Tax=Bradyrhizobium sp. CB1015 TaxID=2976822 RepID=UPI0021AADF33|nr:acetylserotonin O-methyltransferase [Bradyrhizobium sp. CB1015]UWU94950.1 acetylserotonin O-methyltransferase [Bradyrhizobium sp. CB1015]
MTEVRQVTLDPRLDLLALINGFQITQAIRVAVVLRVADHLGDGARSAGELAALTRSHPDSLYRLLRALAAVGVFREGKDRTFMLTPMGECLRTGSGTPLGAWAEFVGSSYVWQAWGHLLHSVRTGENAFQDLNGKDVWQFRAEHPELGALFNRAMTQFSIAGAEAVIRAYDFSPFRHIVDVGGGHGLMLAAILRAHPLIRGTLFDQPEVVAEARAVLAEGSVIERCDIVGGGFFEAVPEGADAYLMRAVIHDWKDDEAIAILKVCRRAAGQAATLLLIERIVGPPNEMPGTKFSDLNMLVSPGGRERTHEEFSDLLGKSGFELTRVFPASTHNVIEARPR